MNRNEIRVPGSTTVINLAVVVLVIVIAHNGPVWRTCPLEVRPKQTSFFYIWSSRILVSGE